MYNVHVFPVQVTEILYVHSKLLIVDDKITVVGSGDLYKCSCVYVCEGPAVYSSNNFHYAPMNIMPISILCPTTASRPMLGKRWGFIF